MKTKQLYNWLLPVALILAIFTGCELGNVKTALTVDGRVAKGAVSGANVEVFRADTAESLGTTTTDSDGYYDLVTEIFYEGAVYIVSTNGSYTDEVTGVNQNIPATLELRANSVVDADNGYTVNVTPFTTISHRKLVADGGDMSPANIAYYNKRIGEIYTGNSNFDVTKVTPNIHNNDADNGLSSTQSKDYGLILAAFTDMAGSPVGVDAKINNFVSETNITSGDIEVAFADEMITSLEKPEVNLINTDTTSVEVAQEIAAIKQAKNIELPVVTQPPIPTRSVEINSAIVLWQPELTSADAITKCEVISKTDFDNLGLIFDDTTCIIQGTPSKAGTHNFIVRPGNDKGNGADVSVQIEVNKTAQANFYFDTATVDAALGTIYSQPAKGGSGTGTIKWSIVTVPAVNVATINTTGNVTMGLVPGNATVTAIKGEDDNYSKATATYEIVVQKAAPNISSDSNITGEYNTSIMSAWVPTNGGGEITGCKIVFPPVPVAGLTISSKCKIEGTPTDVTAGNVQYIIEANNTTGVSQTSVWIDIQPAEQIDFKFGNARLPIQQADGNTKATLLDVWHIKTATGDKEVGAITYTSLSPGVATMGANGNVTYVATGQAVIQAKKDATDHYKEKTIQYIAYVGNPPPEFNTTDMNTSIQAVYGKVYMPSWKTALTSESGPVDSYEIDGNFTINTGMSFNTSTGEITGTPTTTDLIGKSYEVKAINNASGEDTFDIYVQVLKAEQNITFAPDIVKYAAVGESFKKEPTDSGAGTKPLKYSIVNQLLATVIDTGVNAGNVTVNNTGTEGNTTVYVKKDADDNYKYAEANYTLVISDVAPILVNPGDIVETYGQDVSWTPTNDGGAIDNCIITPALTITGLEFNTTTCEITGTAGNSTIAAGLDYTIEANNTTGQSAINLNIKLNKALQTDFVFGGMVGNSVTTIENASGDVQTYQGDNNFSKPASGGNTTETIIYGTVDNTVADVNQSGYITLGTNVANTIITATRPGNDFFEDISISYTISLGGKLPVLNSPIDREAYYGQNLLPTWDLNTTGGGIVLNCYISPDTLNSKFGLTLSNDCKISGTANNTGVQNYDITASNNSGNSTTETIQIRVNRANQTISFSPNIVDGLVGSTVKNEVQGVLDNAIITYSIIPTNSPLAIVANDGNVTINNADLSGNITVKATVAQTSLYESAEANYTLQVKNAVPTIASPGDIDKKYGEVVSWIPVATGGDINFIIDDLAGLTALGLEFNTSTGEIGGTAGNITATDGKDFRVDVNNSSGSNHVFVNIKLKKATQDPLVMATTTKILSISEKTFKREPTSGGSSSEDLVYSSSKQAIADINSSTGLVNPLSVGNTTIKATKPGGEFYEDTDISYIVSVQHSLPDISGADLTMIYKETLGTVWQLQNVGGNITQGCTITPDIKALYGLDFVADKCQIKGTASKTANKVAGGEVFTITAFNETGNDTTTMTLLIQKAIQEQLGWDNNATAYVGETLFKPVDHIGSGTGAYSYSSLSLGLADVDDTGNVTVISNFGNATIQVTRAEDGNYTKATATYILEILKAKPVLASPVPANISSEYNQTISWKPVVSTGTPDSFSITDEAQLNGLGLDFNHTTGEISGDTTDVQTSAKTYKVTATNTSGDSNELEVDILIDRATQPNFDFNRSGDEELTLADANFSKPIVGLLEAPVVTYGTNKGATVVDINATTGYLKIIAEGTDKVEATIGETAHYKATTLSYSVSVGDIKPDISPTPSLKDFTYNSSIGSFDVSRAAGSGAITSCTISPDNIDTKYGLKFQKTTPNVCRLTGVPDVTADTVGTDYTITAINDSGNDTKTITIKILKADQDLFAFNDGNRPDGVLNTSYDYNATGGSGTGLVKYSSNNTAIADFADENNGRVTINNNDKIGTVTISAKKQGDGNYSESPIATYLLTVTAPAVDISTNAANPVDIDVVYGDDVNWITDNIGGDITECNTTDHIPNGLSLSITADKRNCEITGKAHEPLDTPITVKATNSSGTISQKGLNIKIIKADQSPIVFTHGADINKSFTLGSFINAATGGNSSANFIYSIQNGGTFATITSSDGNVSFTTFGDVRIRATKPADANYTEVWGEYMLHILDKTPPSLDIPSSTPAHGDIDVNISADIVLVWDRDVVANAGSVTLKTDPTGGFEKGFDVASQVTFDKNTSTLNMGAARLDYETIYYIEIDAGAVKNKNDIVSTDTAGSVVWRFTTEDHPCTYSCTLPCFQN